VKAPAKRQLRAAAFHSCRRCSLQRQAFTRRGCLSLPPSEMPTAYRSAPADSQINRPPSAAEAAARLPAAFSRNTEPFAHCRRRRRLRFFFDNSQRLDDICLRVLHRIAESVRLRRRLQVPRTFLRFSPAFTSRLLPDRLRNARIYRTASRLLPRRRVFIYYGPRHLASKPPSAAD